MKEFITLTGELVKLTGKLIEIEADLAISRFKMKYLETKIKTLDYIGQRL